MVDACGGVATVYPACTSPPGRACFWLSKRGRLSATYATQCLHYSKHSAQRLHSIHLYFCIFIPGIPQYIFQYRLEYKFFWHSHKSNNGFYIYVALGVNFYSGAEIDCLSTVVQRLVTILAFEVGSGIMLLEFTAGTSYTSCIVSVLAGSLWSQVPKTFTSSLRSYITYNMK